jgi:type 1 glutamine amidotransferase
MSSDMDKDAPNKGQTRRSMFGRLAAATAAMTGLPVVAQAQQAPAARPAPPTLPANFVLPGGTGPIKVLFISSFHPFDRENLFLTLDSMGKDISWTHVEHPAAEAFFDPELAAQFDVFLFYDAFAGRVPGPGGNRLFGDFKDTVPTARLQANTKKLFQNGSKGFVFFHHAIASWTHSWPAGVNGSNAYVEVMGAAADWGTPLKNIRGKDYPASGFRGGTKQHITVQDRSHPVMAGVDDFDITDEAYLCPMFEDSVHCLMRTDFVPVESAFVNVPASNVGKGHPPGSNMTAWVKTAERSPVVYVQHGHDNKAWANPHWRKVILNAIKWAASPESKTWAHANAKKIFV